MWFVVLLGISAVAVIGYLFVIFRAVPGAVDARLGKFEDIPDDVGVWTVDENSDAAKQAASEQLRCERRVLYDEQTGKFTHQTRYRHAETNAITRVDDDRVVKRRRIKPQGA